MHYKKIKPKKLYEQVAEALEQRMVDRELLPGDRLDSVEQLAKSFDVGRSAIREALTSLQAKGLVEIRHGEGTFVRHLRTDDITIQMPPSSLLSQKDMEEIFEARELLELGVIEKAVQHRSQDQLLALQEAIHMMERSPMDHPASSEADFLFHMTIAEAADNQLLVKMLEHISKPLADQIHLTRVLVAKTSPQALERLHDEHLAIYKAIERRDAHAAKEAMSRHLSTVRKLVFT
ncbi:MAG: FadR/GntR family transcriptional regulator [Lysinibacillus sp.]